MAKMGRPPADDPLDVVVHVRMTQQQKDRIEEAATSAEKKIGQWLREVGDAKAKRVIAEKRRHRTPPES